MADPTLKDVLVAITVLDAKIDKVAAKVDKVDGKVDAHRAETNAFRAEVEKRFDDIDRELTKHADVHREVEKDIEALKRRPARTAARLTTRRR